MMVSAKSVSFKQLASSPIYKATLLGSEELVKQLIEEGANPLDKDEHSRYTLLHFAAMMGRLNILKYIIEDSGCNPATENDDGMTALHSAAQCNKLDVVKYLIGECHMDPSALDKHNRSPLTYACENGDLKMVVYLNESNLEYMRTEDVYYGAAARQRKNVNYPLSVACNRGHLPVVKYFVEECGCDPSRAESGKSPLLSAVCGNHVHIVKYLAGINRVQVVGPKAQELSLVDIAVELRSLEMVKFLTLSLKCNPIHVKNGVTTLHAAAKLGQLSILKHLFSLKCDPNIRGWCGRQPIHIAAVKGYLNIVKYLIEEQSCSPSSLDDTNTTPLYLAASDGHLSIVRYLTLQHNCDPLRLGYNFTNSLHAATAYGHLEVIRFIVCELKCELSSIRGLPLLYIAALSGNLDVVNFFMDALGCSPRSRQQTALLCCQLPMYKYLMSKEGVAIAGYGVALSGRLDIVERLSHENIYSKNSSPSAPFDLAMFIHTERRCQYTVDSDQNLLVCRVTYDGYMTLAAYMMREMGQETYKTAYPL